MAEPEQCPGLVWSWRVYEMAPRLEKELKYMPGLEDLPRWCSWSYKPSCSRWIDPSVWISLSVKEKKEIEQEIYEP